MCKYVTVGSDPLFANIPTCHDIAIRMTGRKRVIEKTHRGWNNPIRVHIVAMDHIHEELTVLREKPINRIKRLDSQCGSPDVAKDIPQTGNDVELFIAQRGSQLFRAEAPNLCAIGSSSGHLCTGFDKGDAADFSFRGNTERPAAISGADIQQGLAAESHPIENCPLDRSQVTFTPSGQLAIGLRKAVVRENRIIELFDLAHCG